MTSTNKHHMSPRLAPTFTPHRPQEVLRGMLLALQRCEGEAERKNRYLLLFFESKKRRIVCFVAAGRPGFFCDWTAHTLRSRTNDGPHVCLLSRL